jgi:uncharacterized protein YndB with AHSA1/START domain
MKILKKILFTVLFLIGIFLVTAFFMKKEYAVEREITINQPIDSVFQFVKYLKNQDQFSVWNQKDPKMKRFTKGTDGQVGAINGWDSTMEEVGAGEQEIKKIIDGSRIDLELRFKKPFEATDSAYFITESISSTQTKVKWGFNGKMPYPMNAMLPFMGLEEMLGGDLQKGLNQLKNVLESKK